MNKINEMQNERENLKDISGGNNGEYWIDAADGAITGLNAACVVVSDDAVFSVLTGVTDMNAAYDFKVQYNIGAKTIAAGQFIKAREGYAITAITLTSGTVKAIAK